MKYGFYYRPEHLQLLYLFSMTLAVLGIQCWLTGNHRDRNPIVQGTGDYSPYQVMVTIY